MKSAIFCLCLLFLMVESLICAEENFMCGINIWGTKTGPIKFIQKLGAEWHAPFLNWNHVEGEISQVELTVNQVKNDPWMIDDYIARHDWTRFDDVINTLLSNGFKVFPVIGQCFTQTVPTYQDKAIIPHNPDEPIWWFDNPYGLELYPIGRENFLGHLYLHVRAVVRRYKSEVFHWMVDPELNQSALFRIFGGWKAGNAWSDWNFLTRVLITLHEAVKDEEPSAVFCLPFNVDMPASVTFTYADSWILSGKATVLHWPDAITDWLPYVDVIGIDFFESQSNPDPNCYGRLKGRIETAIESARGKPVIVTSIGVPSGPESLGWTQMNQAEYIAGAFDAACDAGTKGFFFFNIKTSDKHSVTITGFDVLVMNSARCLLNNAWHQPMWQFKISLAIWLNMLIKYFENEHFLSGYFETNRSLLRHLENNRFLSEHFEDELLGCSKETSSPISILKTIVYLTWHFFPVLESAEAYWGIVRPDGSYKPGFYVLSNRYSSIASKPNTVSLNSKAESEEIKFDVLAENAPPLTLQQIEFSRSDTLTFDSGKINVNFSSLATLHKRTVLLQNYPNPFNPETWIPFQLAKPANVVISIYDMNGQLVRKMEFDEMPAGIYFSKDKAFHWNGRNSKSEKVSSGVYFYTLQAGDYSDTKQMLILR